MKNEHGGILDSDLVLLRKIVIESGGVATDDERKADQCEAGVREGGRGVNERKACKREVNKRGGECMQIWEMIVMVSEEKR